MDLTFDHLVHPVHDPEQTRLEFSRLFAMDTASGGVHPQWGTFNTLCSFCTSYLEWIGLTDASVAAQSEFGQQVLHTLELGEGAVQFALRTTNMDAIVKQWQERGLSFEGPVSASRTKPDGRVLSWRMLFPKQEANFEDFRLPFLIEWGDGAPILSVSDEQNPTITALHCLVRNVEAVKNRFTIYFDLDTAPTTDFSFGTGLIIRGFGPNIYLWSKSLVPTKLERPFCLDIKAPSDRNARNDVEFHGLLVRIQS